MEQGATMWAEILTVLTAWFTVVCLLLARVPKLPSIMDDTFDVED